MNNKELELEAEKANGYAYYGKPLGEKYLAFNEGFIAGATSKYVEKQKLEFAIEQYKIIMDNEYCPFPLFIFCKEKIKELEQQLNNLQ